jgi:hypothetical protein
MSSKVLSLNPQLEFELIKQIILRESYIQRLKSKIELSKGEVNMTIIGLLDVLREVTIDVVENLQKWERAQLDYPNIKPFLWNKTNYLVKLSFDLEFLNESKEIRSWLKFDMKNNPFIIPPEALTEQRILTKTSYLLFGNRPSYTIRGPKYVTRNIVSPYLAPVIYDHDFLLPLKNVKPMPEYFRIVNASKAASRPSTHDNITSQKYDGDQKFEIDSSLKDDVFHNKELTPGIVNENAYETYISNEYLHKIKRCWNYLLKNIPSFNHFTNMLTCDETVNDLDFSDDKDTEAQLNVPINSYANTDFFSKSESNTLKTSTPQTASSQNYRPSSRIWTPYDFNLQRLVQKRGGELFTLTAAGKRSLKILS